MDDNELRDIGKTMSDSMFQFRAYRRKKTSLSPSKWWVLLWMLWVLVLFPIGLVMGLVGLVIMYWWRTARYYQLKSYIENRTLKRRMYTQLGKLAIQVVLRRYDFDDYNDFVYKEPEQLTLFD